LLLFNSLSNVRNNTVVYCLIFYLAKDDADHLTAYDVISAVKYLNEHVEAIVQRNNFIIKTAKNLKIESATSYSVPESCAGS
jgi:hypothetical protein